MAAEGVSLLAGLDQLAVMGFAEVSGTFRSSGAWNAASDALLRRGGIDLVSPSTTQGSTSGFQGARPDAGIPVLYYIAPQVWAWKARSAQQLARDADAVAVILPFEEEDLSGGAGGHAVFVGHPLLETGKTIPERPAGILRQAWVGCGGRLLALFPGSRLQEIRRHWRLFLETGRRLQGRYPGLQLAVARASSIPRSELEAPGVVLVEDGDALLAHATAALVKSGTTTLQAALAGTPFVTVYKTHPLTFSPGHAGS